MDAFSFVHSMTYAPGQTGGKTRNPRTERLASLPVSILFAIFVITLRMFIQSARTPIPSILRRQNEKTGRYQVICQAGQGWTVVQIFDTHTSTWPVGEVQMCSWQDISDVYGQDAEIAAEEASFLQLVQL